MAMAIGADLGNMSEAWWCPSLVIPGEEYDEQQLHRGDFATRSMPHTIIVNRKGRRFVNEAQNYNDLMKAFFAFEPNAYERPNLPAWLVFDHAYLEKYALMTVMPGQPAPEWLTRADTLDELAAKLGVDARGLAQTVDRFNGLRGRGRRSRLRPRREPLRPLLRRPGSPAQPEPRHDRRRSPSTRSRSTRAPSAPRAARG